MLERQEAAAMFGEMAFNLIGDYSRSQYSKYKELAKNEQDPDKRNAYEREMSKWAAGGEYKLLLHGLAGGIMAEINNGDFGQGVTVGVVNEMLVGLIDKYTKLDGTKDKETIKAISNKVGELLGGHSGGAIAESATANNYVLHIKNNHARLTETELQQMQALLIACQENQECKDNITNYYGQINANREAEILQGNLQNQGQQGFEVRAFQKPDGSFFIATVKFDSDGNIFIIRDNGDEVSYNEYIQYGDNGIPPRKQDQKKDEQTKKDEIKEKVDEIGGKVDETKDAFHDYLNNTPAGTYLGIAGGVASNAGDILQGISDITGGLINLASDYQGSRQAFVDTVNEIGARPSILLEIAGEIGTDLYQRWIDSENMGAFDKALIRSQVTLEAAEYLAAIKTLTAAPKKLAKYLNDFKAQGGKLNNNINISHVNNADKLNFNSFEKLESHFLKHGGEFNDVYKNPTEYLKGAQDVIEKGYKIQYQYNGEIRTGYVKFMGNTSKGLAKFEFVGTNLAGEITTYHTRAGKSFWKMINGENIPVINPID